MEQFIVGVMEDFGYPGMALLIAVENLFPPIPSEVILTFGGFLTTRTALDVWWVVVWATLGAVAGALALYGVGRALGGERMRALLAGPWGKRLGFDAEAAARAAAWFEQKGAKTVLFCRCVPILRSLISIPAGMAGMHPAPFLLLTTVGSLLWNILLVYLGALAGQSWPAVTAALEQASGWVKAVLVVACAAGVSALFYGRRKKREAARQCAVPEREETQKEK